MRSAWAVIPITVGLLGSLVRKRATMFGYAILGTIRREK